MPTTTPSPSPTPRWMSQWLIAAGVYNILWGGAMGLAPKWTLHLLGVSPPTDFLWPQLWACIGMIIGVYGIGYVLAARDPARHWPIVLVGLLGKILGPIGFVQAASQGQLPWSMGATILTNDLLWWIPFSLILWHAALRAQPAPPPGSVSLDEALDSLHTDAGDTVRALTDRRPTLLVLLRHTGCTFCRQAIGDLAVRRSAIESANLNLALVVPAESTDALRALTVKYQLPDVSLIADPQRLLYRALDVRRGSFLQLIGPRVWWNGLVATLAGHGIGKLEGDGFQMPGAFVLHRGSVLRAVRHSTAGDRPDLLELACPTT